MTRSSASSRVTRRKLLAGTAIATGGLGLALTTRVGAQTPTPPPAPTSTAVPQAPPDPTKVQGLPVSPVGHRSPFVKLERTFAQNPTNTATWSFTPLQDLWGTITPADLHFERHHAGVPIIDPSEHRLIVHGLVERPMEYTMADLQRFPSVTRTYFVECSGNSLAGWGQTKPTDTAQNIHGLVSNSEWTGVPVATILREVGVKPEAKWALAEGADAAVMTRSIPIEKLMDDALLAYAQNGEPLRPEQGFPLRLVLPGWEGNTQIKWLRRLKLGDSPFMTREETSKYTDVMPDGRARQFTFVMEAKSLITWPSAGHILPALGFWEIRGIAWSGRGRITRVEVSTDGGKTWANAELVEPVLPLALTRFRFGWQWNGEETVIVSRATDETGYVQPTKAQLVAVRGTASVYHFNAQQPWRIGRDGRVTNALG